MPQMAAVGVGVPAMAQGLAAVVVPAVVQVAPAMAQEAAAGQVGHGVAFAAAPRRRWTCVGGRAGFLIRCLEA